MNTILELIGWHDELNYYNQECISKNILYNLIGCDYLFPGCFSCEIETYETKLYINSTYKDLNHIICTSCHDGLYLYKN